MIGFRRRRMLPEIPLIRVEEGRWSYTTLPLKQQSECVVPSTHGFDERYWNDEEASVRRSVMCHLLDMPRSSFKSPPLCIPGIRYQH